MEHFCFFHHKIDRASELESPGSPVQLDQLMPSDAVKFVFNKTCVFLNYVSKIYSTKIE